MEVPSAPPGVAATSWIRVAAGLAAIAVLVAVYSNSFRNSFHFDDSHVIESNLYIQSLSNLPRFFQDASTGTSLPANAVYRPLVTTTLALDYWLGGGLHVRQFHITQLALLVALSAMVFALFRGILRRVDERWRTWWVALLAAVLFSIHTTNTETINLIHARSELLSAIGVVGSFLVYEVWPGGRRTFVYLVPMIVGALAKVPAVMFAPLFLVYLWLFEQRLSVADVFDSRSWPRVRAALWKSVPAFGVAAATFIAVNAMNAPTVNYGGGARLQYLQTQCFAWLHYGRLFVLPVGLTADTDWALITQWYDTRVLAGALFIIWLGLVAWKTSKIQAARPVAFGLAWFAIALLPASSIVPLAEVANEHRVFFPFIGLSLAVVWGGVLVVERWAAAMPGRRVLLQRGAVVVALLVITGNAVGTYERNKAYLSEETLWRDVTEKSPANGRAWMNYGLTQMSQGKLVGARQLFERARVLSPNYAVLEVNLGIVNGRLGETVAARQHFLRALQLRPDYHAAHFFYARWLVEQGTVSDAVPHLREAVKLSPGDAAARYLLLDSYAQLGQRAELKALADDTLRLSPEDAMAKRYLDDRSETRRPVSPVPAASDTPADLLNASMNRYQAGDFQGSIDAAKRALALKPDYAEAYNNIAASYASMGRWDEAIAAAHEALRLKPDFPLARNNLAWAEAEKKKVRDR